MMQQAIATGKSPSPFHAIKMPAIRASAPASGVAGGSKMFRGGCGINDCRKGHNRKCDIRYIIQERTDKPVFDRLADQRQRKHADQITGDRYDCNVDINISTHTSAPCSFCASAFSGVISVCGGKRHAAIPAMISVRMIVRVPLEMSRITGRRLHR